MAVDDLNEGIPDKAFRELVATGLISGDSTYIAIPGPMTSAIMTATILDPDGKNESTLQEAVADVLRDRPGLLASDGDLEYMAQAYMLVSENPDKIPVVSK